MRRMMPRPRRDRDVRDRDYNPGLYYCYHFTILWMNKGCHQKYAKVIL